VSLGDWTGIIGVVLAIASLAYARLENRSRARLSDYIRAQNWSLYAKASNANGHTQTALAKLKSLGAPNINLDVLEYLSKADAFGQDLFKDVVRQIKFSEPQFDDQTVSRWLHEGRISASHVLLFRQLTDASKAGTVSQTPSTPQSQSPSAPLV
jgi:hypothetical protein